MFVDPNGEDFGLSAAIIAAVIAAGVATAATTAGAINHYQQTGTWNWGDYLKDVFIQSNISGAVGFASGGLGAVVGEGVAGAVGIAAWDGMTGAVVGGAAGGAVGGAAGYAGNYGLQVATNYQEFNRREFWSGLGISAGTGLVMGGVSGALRYATDPGYRWSLYEKIAGHGLESGQTGSTIEYAAKFAGVDPKKVRYVSDLGAQGMYDDKTGLISISKTGMTELSPNGPPVWSSSNLYETLWHEGQHSFYPGKSGFWLSVEENQIFYEGLNNKYFPFYSNQTRSDIYHNWYIDYPLTR